MRSMLPTPSKPPSTEEYMASTTSRDGAAIAEGVFAQQSLLTIKAGCSVHTARHWVLRVGYAWYAGSMLAVDTLMDMGEGVCVWGRL